jgi:hypothetical protein
VEPKFQQADRLRGALTRVMLNGKVGFIDREGRLAIDAEYDKAWPFGYGSDRTAALRDGVLGILDKNGAWTSHAGEERIPFARAFSTFGSSVIDRVSGWHFKKGNRWGLLEPDGRVVLDAEFDLPVEHCHHRTILASKSNEWLRFKWDGGPLQPAGGRFVEGWCWSPPVPLRIGDRFGLVAADGSAVAPMHFAGIARVNARAWNVKLDGRWGRIAHDGRWLIEPRFDYLSLEEGLVVAAVDDKRGVLGLDGLWVIEPTFDAARLIKRRFDVRLRGHLEPDSAFVTISGATGLLRLKDQSWIIPPRPGIMCDIPDSNAIIWKSGSKLGILSRTGETWYELEADRLGYIHESGLVPFLRSGRWGLVDTAGQVVVEPQFEELDGFVRGIAWARRDGRWCAIDRRGKPVPTIACTDVVPVDIRPAPECTVER